MTTILGIDAAWTATQPSGVALVQQQGTRWRCIDAAPSYASFIERADGLLPDWTRTSIGSAPDPARLLQAAMQLAGEPPALVTLDMPVATKQINGRRAADREVSRTFGAQWCSAHSPGPVRPGPLGAELSRQFSEAGYPIATATAPASTPHRLVEVYPHPALLALLQRDRRVPYKVGKASSYWRGAPVADRIERLLTEFAAILAGLATHIDDIAIPLPDAAEVRSLAALKPVEDAIDALVCCWVGCEYLARRCHPLGDETAAVWCPADDNPGKEASMLKQMWEKLDAYTVSAADGSDRNINVRNEWGGFSRRLKVPVFTGWQDHVRMVDGQMRVLVSDRNWNNTAGVNNQEHWVAYALEHDSEAAFFVIKAVDPLKSPRSVEWLDDTRVLCGKVTREGTQAFVTATRQVQL